MMDLNNALQIEILVANYFDARRNMIIPNVWWGLGLNHECDLFVLTPSGYAYEVEIKVSRSDLKTDQKKKHGHGSGKIKKLYFAIPYTLASSIDLIPERAGVLVVNTRGRVEKIREATPNPTARKLSADERLKLSRLGYMRMWPLKRRMLEIENHLTDLSLTPNWRLEFLG